MKRRAFLAGMIGLPAAAKMVPNANRHPKVISVSIATGVETQQFSREEICRIFRVSPERIDGLASDGHLLEMVMEDYRKQVLSRYLIR